MKMYRKILIHDQGEKMKITSVIKRQRHGNVRMIFIDDKYSFDLSEELYMKHNLYEKSEMTGDEVIGLKQMQMFINAKDEALSFIRTRIRCEKEVDHKLKNSGYDNNTAEEVVNELKSLGYLDDSIYARKYIYDRVKLHPKSKELIKCELLSKGVPKDTAENVLKEWEMDDALIAEVLVRKKFSKNNYRDVNIQKKIYNFLTYRGFGQEVIENLLDNLTK